MINPQAQPHTTSPMLTGSFRDREGAERAYNSLRDRGYPAEEINVLMSDATRKQHFSETATITDLGNKAATGGLTGATIGGTAGAIAGVLAVAGTLAIPGLGLVLAGPLAAGLAGLGAGAAAGGLIGALVGAGIPEERAKVYKTEIEGGGIVLGVSPKSTGDATHFEREWSGYGQHVTV
jgi:hypothetical protein